MTHRVSCTALVTLNVFQNSLARRDPCWRYYADLLRRLVCQPVDWYVTELDLAWAHTFWVPFGGGVDETCQAAYLQMLQLVKPCLIDECILEESGTFSINFCDALRLACARDRNVDAIVTWEPNQFARTVEEQYRVQTDGYFYINLPIENAETGADDSYEIGIFSVGAFLLHLGEIKKHRKPRTPKRSVFSISNFRLVIDDDNETAITLIDPAGRQLEVTARGNSPFDAIQKAIDQGVEQCFPLPTRQISRFFIAPATLISGADAPVEVIVGVECNDLSFEGSACSSNCIRAAADAYIKVINSICAHLGLPVSSISETDVVD